MRVPRSFAFMDLCGFTTLTDTHGDAEAMGVLAAFRLAVRDVCSRRGVRIAKWLGDGAMLVGVTTEPVVSAVLEIERRVAEAPSQIAIRSGLACGDVILFEGDDYIGGAVNLASRLSDLAGPRDVLATAQVADLGPPWQQVEDLGWQEIVGFIRRVRVVRLSAWASDGAAPEALVTDPVCRMELPPETAVTTRPDGKGGTVWFCSEPCADTWDGRAPSAGVL